MRGFLIHCNQIITIAKIPHSQGRDSIFSGQSFKVKVLVAHVGSFEKKTRNANIIMNLHSFAFSFVFLELLYKSLERKIFNMKRIP